jgi:O-glycosyl hydrolase
MLSRGVPGFVTGDAFFGRIPRATAGLAPARPAAQHHLTMNTDIPQPRSNAPSAAAGTPRRFQWPPGSSTPTSLESGFTLALMALLALSLPARGGVTVVQGSGPGATSWPGTPLLSTMANPSSATVAQCYTNGPGSTNLSQTFTITTTNYTLQGISLYAGGGSGTGAGTNLTLKLYDLGFQTAPEPTPYGGVVPNDTISGNLLGSGSGLAITCTNQANGILEFDFTGVDQVVLQVGHMYAFELTGATGTRPFYWYSVTSASAYSGGAAYTNKYWLNGSSTCEFSLAVYAAVYTSAISPPTPQSGSCTVNWNDVHQKIDGFGASSAWRSTWNSSQADLLFSTNTGIGLSLLRSRIAPGGTTIENSIMQMAQARGARVWSSPWSPATTFKGTNLSGVISLNGGTFLGGAATNQAYASQLAAYVINMKNTYGINLYALSVQNEPDVNTTGYESCVWTGPQISDFIPYLAGALAASNVASTKIILPESQHWQSNTNLFTPAMTNPTVAALVSIIANHNYDGINAGNTANSPPAALPSSGKPTWETEVSSLRGSQSGIQNGVYWAGRIHAYLTVAEATAYHYWWLLSANSTPNQGLFDTAGNPTKRMYVFGNFSRFVRPDYYRVGVVTNSGAAIVSAYKDPNSGLFAIVAINPNLTNAINQTFTLNNFTPTSVTPWVTSASLSLASQSAVAVSGSSFTAQLPALSVVTFVGQYISNSAPTNISLSDSSVPENQAAGTAVGTFSTTDPDAGNTFAYSLVGGTGGADNASFTLSGATLQTAAVFDYEIQSSYSIRVRSTDQGGLSTEKVFTITVQNVNEAPTAISLLNSSVPENQPAGTAVGTLSTTDPDVGDTFTYSLVSGAGSVDNAAFSLSGSTLQTAAVFDFEAQSNYSLRVRSTDQGGLHTETVFTITVLNANEAPTDIGLSNSSAPENQPAGTAVGTFSTTDPDFGDTFAYSLVSGAGSADNGSFAITGDALQTAAVFDYAAQNNYSIRVRSTDLGGFWVEKALNLSVTTTNYPQQIQSISLALDGNWTLTCQGLPGSAYQIEATGDLALPWSALTNNVDATTTFTAGTNGLWTHTDLNSTNYTTRYYRTVAQ